MEAIAINQSSQHFRVPPPSHPTVTKMESFQYLPVGWHYGEGRPCAPEVLRQALLLHNTIIALGFSETDAFPGIDGGILLTVYEGVEYFAFRLEIDGTIIYSRETQDVEVDERENLTLSQAQAILCTYRKEIWTRSVSYTSGTLIAIENGSLLRPSRLIVTGFPSWTPVAR